MAIWQFNIYLISKIKFEQLEKSLVDLELEDPLYDAASEDWLSILNLSFSQLQLELNSFGNTENWTKKLNGLRTFGDLDHNDFSVTYNQDDIIEAIHCRISLMETNIEFIKHLISFLKKHNCLMFDTSRTVFDPDFKSLITQMKSSQAWIFLKNPKEFEKQLLE